MELLSPSQHHPLHLYVPTGHPISAFSPATSPVPSEAMAECDETVHVAVGKSPDKSLNLLQWTFNRFRNSQICILHVHQPSPLIPTLCKSDSFI